MAENTPNLYQAYRSLDHAKPLEGIELVTYYAQRPGEPIARIADEVKDRSQPFRAILSGQRGVGKTTELNWIKDELIKAGECVFLFDLARFAVKNAVTPLAFVAKELARKYPKSARDHPEIDFKDLLTKRKWTHLDFEEFVPPDYMPEVVRSMEEITKAIQEQRGRELVLLLDGWERVYSNENIYPFMEALERANCSTILVTRLSAVLEGDFDRYRGEWDLTILPAIPLFTEDRYNDEDGWSLLSTVLEKRAGQGTFEPRALGMLIPGGAGVFREVIGLARNAAGLAKRAGKTTVTAEHAESALREQKLGHTSTLSLKDLEFLKQFSQQRERSWAAKEILEQVDRGTIVAYHRKKRWFDVHPLLWPDIGLSYPSPPKPFR